MLKTKNPLRDSSNEHKMAGFIRSKKCGSFGRYFSKQTKKRYMSLLVTHVFKERLCLNIIHCRVIVTNSFATHFFSVSDPDPLRFLFPNPDPIKKALIWIRVAPKL